MARRRNNQGGGRRRNQDRQPSAATAARVRAAKKTNRMPWIIGGLVGAVIVLGLIFIAYQEATRERPGVSIADLGNLHIDAIDAEHEPYNTSPPTSGPHIGNVAPSSIYTEQIPDEVQVHNLEDGFVIVHYYCPEGCDELVGQLTDAVAPHLGATDSRVILEPYAPILDSVTDEPRRIALTAWTRIDTFDEFDEVRINAFIDAYQGIDHHVAGQG